MNRIVKLSFAAAILTVGLASCSKKENFVGTWQATSPADITNQLPASSSAAATYSMTFGEEQNGSGNVMLTALIDVTQPVDPTLTATSPYEVSVAATATISGTWTYEHGDDDDLLVTLDNNSLKVTVDPNGIAFRENIVDGAQSPANDSITNATKLLWEKQVSAAMQKEFSRFSRIEDLKVQNSNGIRTIKFELENPEQKLVYRAAE